MSRSYSRLIESSFVIKDVKKKIREDVITGEFSFTVVSDPYQQFTKPDTIVFKNGAFRGKLYYTSSEI
jgi:hypothetical protein